MIRGRNNEIDVVSAGSVIMIIGLLFILMASGLSDFSYAPRDTVGYDDKMTRIPDYIAPSGFNVVGLLFIVIGGAVFLKNFVNMKIDVFIERRNEKS
ncbi:MAG: hypothetical protein KAR76_03650 [Methanosarcinales archaeon]|nr:hypothetical protein [Methanosarcinales archaeon]